MDVSPSTTSFDTSTALSAQLFAQGAGPLSAKGIDAAFWEEEMELLYEILYPIIFRSAMKGAETALKGLVGGVGGVDWGLVSEAVRAWASRYTYELVHGITDTTRRFLQDALPNWIASGAPLDDLVSTLEPMFGPVRAEMIAVTEVTRAFAEGNLEVWKESGVVDGKRWMTGEDELVCPICSELSGMESGLDGDFNGYGAPPAHVNCRCYLQPVVRI